VNDNVEALLHAELNGNNTDPLKAILMQGLNPHLDPNDPIALNDDKALKASILNAIHKGTK
jgi:hypothetical protein